MRLAAIYSVFDGEELLEGSIAQIRPHLDFVLCAAQTISNQGEHYDGGWCKCQELKSRGLEDELTLFTPVPGEKPARMERDKRIGGARAVAERGFTHFLYLDCDEYYDTEQFAAGKGLVDRDDIDGSVAHMKTYFKRPDWQLEGLESDYVPFIHRARVDIRNVGRRYPFPCDATRTVDAQNVIALPAEVIVMHHYSWVRNDIMRKVRNSTLAGYLKEQSTLLQDYNRAQLGDSVSHGTRRLIQTVNQFNIRVGSQAGI
jgi:hypothetical protein